MTHFKTFIFRGLASYNFTQQAGRPTPLETLHPDLRQENDAIASTTLQELTIELEKLRGSKAAFRFTLPVFLVAYRLMDVGSTLRAVERSALS